MYVLMGTFLGGMVSVLVSFGRFEAKEGFFVQNGCLCFVGHLPLFGPAHLLHKSYQLERTALIKLLRLILLTGVLFTSEEHEGQLVVVGVVYGFRCEDDAYVSHRHATLTIVLPLVFYGDVVGNNYRFILPFLHSRRTFFHEVQSVPWFRGGAQRTHLARRGRAHLPRSPIVALNQDGAFLRLQDRTGTLLRVLVLRGFRGGVQFKEDQVRAFVLLRVVVFRGSY